HAPHVQPRLHSRRSRYFPVARLPPGDAKAPAQPAAVFQTAARALRHRAQPCPPPSLQHVEKPHMRHRAAPRERKSPVPPSVVANRDLLIAPANAAAEQSRHLRRWSNTATRANIRPPRSFAVPARRCWSPTERSYVPRYGSSFLVLRSSLLFFDFPLCRYA